MLMRLLDLIAQGHSQPIFADDGRGLPSSHRFAAAMQRCPLRYVLSDELTRCATQLAFAEGDRVSACLDLIRVPAQSLWVEWADVPRREALRALSSLGLKAEKPEIRHAGALLSVTSNGRSGHIRTFWSTIDEQAYLSPLVTEFDLDRPPPPSSPIDSQLWRGETRLKIDGEPALEELLEHLRFHFDDDWAAYYHERCQTQELRAQVLKSNLSGCAFDAPMLMAFFLLLGARDLLPRQTIRHERLNRTRQRSGKAPLLEHVEVSAPLDRTPSEALPPAGESVRVSPRLHHVRGHIVRRGTSVFWRSPHIRGSARLGQVRSRTVILTFAHAAPSSA